MARRSKAKHAEKHAKLSHPWLERWRSKAPVLRFGLSFAVLMAAYYGLAMTQPFDRVLHSILRWNAVASAALLGVLGQGIQTTDTVIRSARFSVNIRRGCDALEPVWYFTAAVLSFPAATGRKLAGIAAGVSLICVANILRISSLFLIGSYYPRTFSLIHLEIWPAILILLAVCMWIAWIGWARRATAHEQP